MTNEKILASGPSRELCDASAIEVMDWHEHEGGGWWMDSRNVPIMYIGDWLPDIHIAQAFTLQERIKELGLQASFSGWLERITEPVRMADPGYPRNSHWYLIIASARDRTVAAILAVRGK